MDWEQKTAIKRSEHTFFQNLYRIKQELPGAKASTAINTEVVANFVSLQKLVLLYSHS